MFLVIIGGAPIERRQKAKDVLVSLFPKTSFQFSLFDTLPTEDALLALSFQSESFFNDKHVVLLKEIGASVVDTYTKDTLQTLADSSTPFIFLEESITKPTLTFFEKNKAKVVTLPKKEKKSSFVVGDVFAICDAFSAKKRFLVWHEYSKLVAKNESPEAIIGILFSRIRAMLRDKRYGVYKKDQLQTLSSSLALLLPKERAQGNDSQLALERWILMLPE